MTDQPASTPPPPSRGAIAKATAAAVVMAAIVLVTAVLPAEYGIDPLGTGEALGLLGLAGVSDAPLPDVTAAAGGPLAPQTLDFKVDSMTFTLEPSRFVEYKYQLAEGASMLYSWEANGPVEFDFHTEPALKGAAGSETFARGEAADGRGSYRAPYAGIHGWYWKNNQAEPVVVTLNTTGFYTAAREFLEDGTSVAHPVEDRSPTAP